ncbi:hypothetical protein LY76DRAFT_314154 [Colletotrichum caudatum]|nr:hypothetical protein LY76DRAFT_314154 [Colletotrichum caudatum]
MESISLPFFLHSASRPACLPKPALGFRRPDEPNGRRCKVLEGETVLHQFRITRAAHAPPSPPPPQSLQGTYLPTYPPMAHPHQML